VLAPGADLLATFARREAARRVVSLDPNVRAALVGDRAAYRRRLEEVAAMAQVVKASEEDLGWLHPGEAVEAAAQRWQRHSGGLLDGLYRIGGLHPGGPGALRVDELDAVLAFAARVAAVTCSRPGADPPYRRELDLA
jgi:fructokinase